MNVLLQNHNAKHVCDVPDGLRELCADISREVIRVQPDDLYCFAADYLDTLLITRENAKAAIKIVQNVVLKSENIVEILCGTGLKLNEIAAAAPRLQKAFRTYLDVVDMRKMECGCDGDFNGENEVSICQILRKNGANIADARRAVIKIQALFRGHYERLTLAEKRGEVQWQRAAANTMELLRKSGISEIETSNAATVIQAAYRGYYTRKNLKLRKREYLLDSKINMKTWLDIMFENKGLTYRQANDAAKIIQNAFRKYRSSGFQGQKLTILSRTFDQVESDIVNEEESVVEPCISKQEPDISNAEFPRVNSTDEVERFKILSFTKIINDNNANISIENTPSIKEVIETIEDVKSISENIVDQTEKKLKLSEHNEGQDEQEDQDGTREIEN